MKEKKYTIHLLGEDIDICFNMATIIGYEEITGQSFYGESFETAKTRYALLAAVLAQSDAKEDIGDRLLKDVDFKEFTDAFAVIMEAASEFFNIPQVMQEEEHPQTEEEGEKGKN